MKHSHLAAALADVVPYLRAEFVGSVAGILNVAYGADSSPPAQDTNLIPLDVRRSGRSCGCDDLAAFEQPKGSTW